jgi:hypothetical protein
MEVNFRPSFVGAARGKRARRLVAVARPKFRDESEQGAEEINYL